MEIIETTRCEALGKTMLMAKPTHTITAAEHASLFFVFDTCDVWTQDGWLVTAVQENGIHHLRKGSDRATARLDADEVLRYTPNFKALVGTLTPEHAKTYAAQTDKLVWIETMLLDPNDIPRKHAERVEDVLIALLKE